MSSGPLLVQSGWKLLGGELPTNRKWVVTLVINEISGVSPLITGVITHLLSGMNHQVATKRTKRHHFWMMSCGNLPRQRATSPLKVGRQQTR